MNNQPDSFMNVRVKDMTNAQFRQFLRYNQLKVKSLGGLMFAVAREWANTPTSDEEKRSKLLRYYTRLADERILFNKPPDTLIDVRRLKML